nr:hypothetical protein [Amycolatopsis sp. PS_44_ISF1]
MDVEHPALRARDRRDFGFVDRGGNAVDVQDSGQSEAAEPSGRIAGLPVHRAGSDPRVS